MKFMKEENSGQIKIPELLNEPDNCGGLQIALISQMEKPKFEVFENVEQLVEAYVGEDADFENSSEINRKLDDINHKAEKDEDFMFEIWIKFTQRFTSFKIV